jgi:hypothetical protein
MSRQNEMTGRGPESNYRVDSTVSTIRHLSD